MLSPHCNRPAKQPTGTRSQRSVCARAVGIAPLALLVPLLTGCPDDVQREFRERDQEPGLLELRARCREYAAGWVDVQREEFRRLGIWGEWKDPYLTMSRAYEADIVETFADLVEAGYVYRGLRPIHWCVVDRTALAEAEKRTARQLEQHVRAGAVEGQLLHRRAGGGIDVNRRRRHGEAYGQIAGAHARRFRGSRRCEVLPRRRLRDTPGVRHRDGLAVGERQQPDADRGRADR